MSEADRPPARIEHVGRTAVITLDRSHVLNAANARMTTLVGEALEALDQDDSVRAIVLTGGGLAPVGGSCGSPGTSWPSRWSRP